VRLLLDTHVLLWTLGDETRLAPAARRAIAGRANRVFVSSVNAWEIAIKAALGRLKIPPDMQEWLPLELEHYRFEELPLTIRHCAAVHRLPPHHADPFDRALIAQASTEGLTLVTSDSQMKRYGVPILPAV